MVSRTERSVVFILVWAIAGGILIALGIFSLTVLSQALAFLFVGVGGSIVVYGWGEKLAPPALRGDSASYLIDDLQNPAVRLELQTKMREEVERLVSTNEAKEILREFPHTKTFIDSLRIMDEKEARVQKIDLSIQIDFDMMARGSFAELYPSQAQAQTLGESAIETMTIHKDAKMLRGTRPTFTAKEKTYREKFPSAFYLWDTIPEKMTGEESTSYYRLLTSELAKDAMLANARVIGTAYDDRERKKKSKEADEKDALFGEVESYFRAQLMKRVRESRG